MISILILAISAQAGIANITVPYQALPAFMTYTECVSAHLSDDERRRSANNEEVRQANSDAVAACREVRAEQLALGIAAVGDERTPLDTRTYRNRADAQRAVLRAFDRFDTDFDIEPLSGDRE